jgi:hypothetical protein
MAREVIATLSRIHTLESRVNNRFGNGSIRKSSLDSRLVTRPSPPRTSSLRIPAVRTSLSSSGDISPSAVRR